METPIDPLDALTTHGQIMCLAYTKALNDLTKLCDSEFKEFLGKCYEIHSKRFPKTKQNGLGINEDDFFNEILDTYLKEHKDKHFSFYWIESAKQLEALSASLINDEIYKKTIKQLSELPEGGAVDFENKIRFLAAGIRFYHELNCNGLFSYEKDLPIMLKVDRVLSMILSDIAVIKATSSRRRGEANRLTIMRLIEQRKKPNKQAHLEEAISKVLQTNRKDIKNLTRFVDKIRFSLSEENMCDPKTVRTYLNEKHNMTAKNFETIMDSWKHDG